MFKKIIIAAISASFIASAAIADSTNVGVRLSAATMSATGSETQDSAGSNSGGAVVTNQFGTGASSREADFELPSLFVERQFDMGGAFSVAIGLDFVPLTAEVDKIGGDTGTDASIKAGNLLTGYIQPTYAVSEKISIYGKIGYAEGDLEIRDLVRQATVASQTDDIASTDVKNDSTLEGPVYGYGVQMNNDSGLISFVRLEVTHTEFDQIKHTNSNGKVLKADPEMDLITFTIGKSF